MSVGECQRSVEQYVEEHGLLDWLGTTVEEVESGRVVMAVDFDEHGKQYAATMIKRLTHEFRITGDHRKAAEARQWASEFGLVEAAPDKLEIDGDLSLSSEEKELLDEMFDEDPR